jgi:hypothetical protein
MKVAGLLRRYAPRNDRVYIAMRVLQQAMTMCNVKPRNNIRSQRQLLDRIDGTIIDYG